MVHIVRLLSYKFPVYLTESKYKNKVTVSRNTENLITLRLNLECTSRKQVGLLDWTMNTKLTTSTVKEIRTSDDQ